MRGAETVNDECEVGLSLTFEAGWVHMEQIGRVVMTGFTLTACLGLLGRGPFSHASIQSAGR